MKNQTLFHESLRFDRDGDGFLCLDEFCRSPLPGYLRARTGEALSDEEIFRQMDGNLSHPDGRVGEGEWLFCCLLLDWTQPV